MIDLFDKKDKRRDVTVGVTGGLYNKDSVFVKLPTSTNQTYTKKYITLVAVINDSRANWKVIRYADVLLMLAKALNDNGKITEALSYLNQVRTRAGMPGYSNLTKEATRDKIHLERRLEISFEGERWFDLVRTGQRYTTMKNVGRLPYMAVFPLPLSEIRLVNNTAIYPQNDGYN